jgi:hypothetical protein
MILNYQLKTGGDHAEEHVELIDGLTSVVSLKEEFPDVLREILFNFQG